MKNSYSRKAFLALFLSSPLAFAQAAADDAETTLPPAPVMVSVVEETDTDIPSMVAPEVLPPSPEAIIADEQKEEIMEAVEASGFDLDDYNKEDALKVLPLIDELLKRNNWQLEAIRDLLFVRDMLITQIAEKPEDLKSLIPTVRDVIKRYPQYAKEIESWIEVVEKYSLEEYFEATEEVRIEFKIMQEFGPTQAIPVEPPTRTPEDDIDDEQNEAIMAAVDATGIDMKAYTKEDALKVLALLDELLKRNDWQLKALHDLLFVQGIITAQIAEKPEDLKSLMPTARDVIKRYPQYAKTLESWIDSDEEYSLELHFKETSYEREEFEAMQKEMQKAK